MPFSILLTLAVIFWQSDVPYKPKEEFQLDLDFKLKQRQASDISTFDYEETRQEHDKKQYGGGPLPYLIVKLKVLKLADEEVRVRVVTNEGKAIITKKAEVGSTFKLDLGYTDDMKDRVTAYEYTIFFISDKKKEISRIHLLVQEDGMFMINGEKRGKF